VKGQADIREALERLIQGDLRPPEAARMAAQAGYRTFADLCEAELPTRLPRLRLDRLAVRRRLQQALQGRLPLDELRGWAEELSAVLDRHELGISLLERRRLGEALALVAVATDQRIFRNQAPVVRVLGEVAEALGRRRGGPVAPLYGELFEEQPELHLLTRRLDDVEGEGEEEEPGEQGPPSYLPQAPSFLDNLGIGNLELDSGLDQAWGGDEVLEGEELGATKSAPAADRVGDGLRHADVVALSRPYEPGARVQEYEWVVAFSVATHGLVAEDRVPSAPAEGFFERVSEVAPNFDLQRYRPEARRDPDGVLEIVLEAASIGRAELVYASKLFGLVHGVGRVWFEGERLRTIGPR
jgi:hypothetical protein